jgi:hypothetical protein
MNAIDCSSGLHWGEVSLNSPDVTWRAECFSPTLAIHIEETAFLPFLESGLKAYTTWRPDGEIRT